MNAKLKQDLLEYLRHRRNQELDGEYGHWKLAGEWERELIEQLEQEKDEA